MANYYGNTRTNYFHVKNPDAFRDFMKTVGASEDNVHLWEETDRNGEPIFAFGCYGTILGVATDGTDGVEDYGDDGEYYDFEEFVFQLSEHVAPNDAVIVIEVGNEKLRYLVGSALIVTDDQYEFLDLNTMAAECAAQMLGNSDWKTRMDY